MKTLKDLTPSPRYRVRLAHTPNPDIRDNGGYWSAMRRQKSPLFRLVASLAEASRTCREYIEQNDLGGGNWTGGQVCLGNVEIGRVSYNGRVWDVNGREILLDATPPAGELLARGICGAAWRAA